MLKFQQLPLTGTNASAPYIGHDETSTAYATFDPLTSQPTGWQGTFMADDFADGIDSPVVHVSWWGSYAENFRGNGGVRKFLITFASDVPAGGAGGGASHPGDPLLSQILVIGPLAPGSGTFTEHLVSSSGTEGAELLYHYNGELNYLQPFPEQPNTVYWMTIVALVDSNQDGAISWGWHDRDWSVPDALASTSPNVTPGESVLGGVVSHFQDDAVSGSIAITPGLVLQPSGITAQNYLDGVDGPTGISQYSKDLAFELYVVPEPATGSLVVVGVTALGVASRRRRSR